MGKARFCFTERSRSIFSDDNGKDYVQERWRLRESEMRNGCHMHIDIYLCIPAQCGTETEA